MESLCSLLQQAALNMCVCLKLPSENMKCIWMQCDKKMFGLEKDVIVGAMLRTSTRKVVIYFLFVPFKLILLTCLRTLLVLFRCLLMSYCVVTLTPMWGS